MPTLKQALLAAQQSLTDIADNPDLEASMLLCHLLNKPKSHLYTWPEAKLSEPQQQRYQKLIEQRQQGMPIAYILQQREFWSLSLRVTPDTLIPRAESELLVERAIHHLQSCHNPTAADLGTGSGAIALALASERPDARVVATDLHQAALNIATENAQRLDLRNLAFHAGDWCDALPEGEQFDVILSNPPYIESADPHLAQGDLPYEPQTALVSGEDGLDDIRTIIKQAPVRLKRNGWLLLEHGYNQAAAVRRLMQSAGMSGISSHEDLAGQPRVTEGCRS
ncbi:protein-(glutamine-N5) methyltransferase, release factor-specific [Candidatus Thiodiazotropha endoloripes]|uniref:peptide chain release factor N(5)-glutamine methyltransferase n=1 Tax=Candidatus Thiodiazotropha endoloripes TaxID=1818881 RepID=UPI00083D3FA5|nr:peptide chain release factor N(5)-glutamine methyltransferase [Candidatus Thiodiazotropha endoloripes]ODB83906.1 protein-(glutamine-N5) methyltransferase, release factor-specific [Candidatus Thiodiazotropha endoloripes]ODB90500.1 protein-(glutamine-N5) methyltransferase, release factor-specific [Candidatus Thiodiazotropha endoloripes]